MLHWEQSVVVFLVLPGVPKNATDLKYSYTSCFKLKLQLLSFSKFTILRLNFEIFFRILGDLVPHL